jgi:hypothetical protein
MQVCEPIKKTFVRFFTWPRLFADGYSVVKGNGMPRKKNIPDLEVPSRNLADLNFSIPADALGFVLYEVITAQVDDNGQIKELTSEKINHSGRHFFQQGDNGRCAGRRDYGRIATKDEAREEYYRHTSIRAYCCAPLPERIILYTGKHYHKHDYSLSRVGRHHTRENAWHVCTFDFLKTDVVVPIFFVFHLQTNMIKASVEKKGWIMPHQCRVA